MIQAQATKKVIAVAPGVIKDDASFTATAIDTLGFGHCVIDLVIGATDIAFATLKLQESDDDSTYTDVTGGNFSTSGTLPSDTADNTIVAWDVDCAVGTRKRYLKVVATAGNGSVGTYMAGLATLSRAEQAPNSTSERGYGQVLYV